MKKTFLLIAGLCLILWGCSKNDPSENYTLSGSHPVTIVYAGNLINDSTGIENFSHTYEGTMDITPQATGIYISVHADQVNIDANLDITDRVSKNVIRYESSSSLPGQQPPYLQYTPSDGRFYYYQMQVIGHRENSTYQVSGKL